MKEKGIIRDSLFGFIVGDAMGVPTEFCIREKLLENPVKEMIADTDNFGVPAGSWSDDTSMTIATIDSIINQKEIDYQDIMNNFVDWLNNAKYTPTGEVFDVGRTCLSAIAKYYKEKCDPIECGAKGENYNGNGSLMRILPIVLYCYYKELTEEKSFRIIKDISSLTHAHEVSILACYIYYLYIKYLIELNDKEVAYQKVREYNYSKYFTNNSIDLYKRILKNNISKYELDDISSKGYVVDTLEAAFWCFLRHNNYDTTILTAINMGNDTDTVAAITGGLAGIYYGYENINKEWINKLQKKEYLEELIKSYEEILIKKDYTSV